MSDSEYVESLLDDILPLLEEIFEFKDEDGNFYEDNKSLHSSSTITAEAEQAEPCDNAENDNEQNEDCSIASQETVENRHNRNTNEKYDSSSEEEPTNQEKNAEDEENNLLDEDGRKSKKLHDPDRDKLLAMLEGDEEPEMSVEDKLEKIHKENKDEEKNKETTPNLVSNQAISSTSEVPTFDTPILHPYIDTLIDLTDEQKVVTIKVEPVVPVVVIDDDPWIKEEKEDTTNRTATEGNKIKTKTQNLDPEPSTSSTGLYKNNNTYKKVEEVVVKEDDPCVKEKKEDIRNRSATEGNKIKTKTQNLDPEPSTSSTGLYKNNKTCKKVEEVVVIDDDPCVKKEEEEDTRFRTASEGNKIQMKTENLDPEPSTSSTGLDKNKKKCKKVEPTVIIEDDPPIKIEKNDTKQESNNTERIVIKSERQDEPAPSTSRSVAERGGTEKETFPGNEAEEGEVVDDGGEIPVNSIVQIKQEPITLVNPALGNVVAAGFGVGGLPQQALYASLMTDYQIAKMAKSIHKLTKYVSKHKGKKKFHNKKITKKSKSRRSRNNSSSSRSRTRSRSRSRSRPRSRSRSTMRANKPNAIFTLKKTYHPKQYRSRSPSQSPSRGRHSSYYKRNYRSNNRSRSSSRSLSKSPQRKRHHSNSFKARSYSRSPSLPKTKALVKKNSGRRSPSASPPRRKRRYSSSSSSSTDASSSSPRYKRRHLSVSSRSRSRSRSCTPNKSHTIHSSKRVPPTNVSRNSIRNRPSTSQQTFVAQQTYQQEIRQGSNVMTRQAIVTTSYKAELQSFKNSLINTVSDSSNSSNAKNLCELITLEITVFDEGGKDVTNKRPDGDLNHPFYIHPEDAELYQMKCRNGLQPLQALHEICVKCGWRLPNYLLLPTPKGFRFGMEINGHKFVTEKSAQQKKLAKAAAALTVLQWMKIVSVSPDK